MRLARPREWTPDPTLEDSSEPTTTTRDDVQARDADEDFSGLFDAFDELELDSERVPSFECPRSPPCLKLVTLIGSQGERHYVHIDEYGSNLGKV